MNEKTWDDSTPANSFVTSEDIYPVNAIVAASGCISKSHSDNQALARSSDAISKYLKVTSEPLRPANNPQSHSSKVTSPSSTVSSRTNNDVTFSHGQNTFNSTDSSGYSSSTDHSLKLLSISGPKSNPPVLPEETVDCCIEGEDCPEDSASEFSFRLYPSIDDSAPTATNTELTKRYINESRQAINPDSRDHQRFKTPSNDLSVPPPTPAPRSRFPSRLTTSPSPVFQTEPLSDPWLHRSQVSDAEQVFSSGKINTNFFPFKSDMSFFPNPADKPRCLLQRSKSERGCASHASSVPILDVLATETNFHEKQMSNKKLVKSKIFNVFFYFFFCSSLIYFNRIWCILIKSGAYFNRTFFSYILFHFLF